MDQITPTRSYPYVVNMRRRLQRSPDSVELRGFGPGTRAKVSHRGTQTMLTISDKLGNSNEFVQRHECPKSWDPTWWNPAHWSLHQDRVDNLGRTWSRCGGTFVVDNFGYLVEVPQ